MSDSAMSAGQISYQRPVQRAPVKIFNILGRALRRVGVPVVDLSAQSLCAAAMRRTGLADFGDESFREPLEVLLRSLETEARLNTFGRIHARGYITNALSNRLMLEHWWTRHPEILTGTIREPLYILGLPRTGTSLLLKLLASDPARRWLAFWEAHEPCPPPSRDTYAKDPRRRRAARRVRTLDYLAPDFRGIHEFESDGPEECYPLLANTLIGAQYSWMFVIPGYDAWLSGCDMKPPYAYYRRQLLLLQWRWPAERWVLKSPVHLFALDALLANFPDARIVHLHRDPAKVVASLCSLVATTRAVATDTIDNAALGAQVVDGLVEGLDRCMRAREAAEPAHVCDVQYVDLLRDPMATVRHIYARFGLALSAEAEVAMKRCLAESPQHKHGVHRYSLAQWGLSAEGVRRQFARYREAFAIGDEA
ncbi:MAG: sulfotransferase [Deltaproteobacteria bacterium]|nr:sulfotransferase [Deltaproteobacteria bacterium]